MTTPTHKMSAAELWDQLRRTLVTIEDGRDLKELDPAWEAIAELRGRMERLEAGIARAGTFDDSGGDESSL